MITPSAPFPTPQKKTPYARSHAKQSHIGDPKKVLSLNSPPALKFLKQKVTENNHNKLSLPNGTIIFCPPSLYAKAGHILVKVRDSNPPDSFFLVEALGERVIERESFSKFLIKTTVFCPTRESQDIFKWSVSFLEKAAIQRASYSIKKAVASISGGYFGRTESLKLAYSIAKETFRYYTDTLNESSHFCSELGMLAIQVGYMMCITGESFWNNMKNSYDQDKNRNPNFNSKQWFKEWFKQNQTFFKRVARLFPDPISTRSGQLSPYGVKDRLSRLKEQ